MKHLFTQNLIQWYALNSRNLPWRTTKDPYKIWLSEIILQQTRVEQGLSYYHSFIENFPDVYSLASASEQEVLRLWQGLGYYSRARNLHFTAKEIVEKYKGTFPREYKDVLRLKGIGPYTASAIVSFAYNAPYPVVDGNVFRVFTRLYGISEPIDTANGKKIVQGIAEELLDKVHSDTYNQAIMDFGSLVCSPKPKCEECPMTSFCEAVKSSPKEYPVKSKKVKVRKRYFHFFDIVDVKGNVLLSKRGDGDIWNGLYQFPLVEMENTSVETLVSSFFKLLGVKQFEINIKEEWKTIHKLSHQHIYTNFYKVQMPIDLSKVQIASTILPVSLSEIPNYPLPRVITKYMEQLAQVNG